MSMNLNMCALAISLVVASQAPSTVPEGLRNVAQSSPVEFVMALANAGIPVGLEIDESDDVLPPDWPTRNGKRPAWYHLDESQRVALSEIIAAFNSHHQTYRAAAMGGVLVIRPVSGRSAFLDAPASVSGTATAKGTMAAARRLFVAIEPALAGPSLNSLRSDDQGAIDVDGSGSPSVIQMLNRIVTQQAAGPWRAWVVITRKDGTSVKLVQFGFIGKDGSRRKQGLTTSR
jgi:hypothetical protein